MIEISSFLRTKEKLDFQKFCYSQFKGSTQFPISRILVGVGGGSAAGKTTLCELIKNEMNFDQSFDICIIALDCFYRGIDQSVINVKEYNFDHPDALDFDLALEVLTNLLNGQITEVPIYDFKTHKRCKETTIVQPAQIIFFEGILALYDQRILEKMQYKIFIHCDGRYVQIFFKDDIRLSRRILRDVLQRGRTVDGVLCQYNKFVKQAFDLYIKPTVNCADIIFPGSRSTKVAVQFIVHYLKNLCKQTGILKVSFDQLYFFGDLLYSFDDSILEKEDHRAQNQLLESQNIPCRNFIFPTSEPVKQELNSRVAFLTSTHQFDKKQLYAGIKSLIKQCLTMLLHGLKYQKIPLRNVSLVNLKDLFTQNPDALGNPKVQRFTISDQKVKELSIKDYVLVLIPFFHTDAGFCSVYYSQLQEKLYEHHPKVKIIIISAFSSIKMILHLTPTKNFGMMINTFLVGRQINFSQIIWDSLPSEDQTPSFSWFFYSADKMFKKANRFLQKKQEKIV